MCTNSNLSFMLWHCWHFIILYWIPSIKCAGKQSPVYMCCRGWALTFMWSSWCVHLINGSQVSFCFFLFQMWLQQFALTSRYPSKGNFSSCGSEDLSANYVCTFSKKNNFNHSACCGSAQRNHAPLQNSLLYIPHAFKTTFNEAKDATSLRPRLSAVSSSAVQHIYFVFVFLVQHLADESRVCSL